MRKFSISDKLILASLILSIVTIIIVASYSFINTREAILDRTFNQLTSIRLIKSTLIEDFFQNRVKEVELAASSSDIVDIIKELNNNGLQKSPSKELIEKCNKSRDFISHISAEHFSKVSIIGNNHIIYGILPPNEREIKGYPSNDSLWSTTLSSKTAVLSDLINTDKPNQSVITISSKVIDEDKKPVGIIVFEISTNSINSIMLDNNPENGLGNSGESYLVGNDMLMRSSSRFQENSVLSTVVNTVAVQKALSGISDTEVIDDYRGISVLSSFGMLKLEFLNWVIITEIDFKEATIPIYRIRNEIVFISIFIFFLVLMVVFILSRRITFPLQRLNHAAYQVGSGNLDVEIVHNLNDEIGDLTNTFNKMIHRLKDQTEELKQERIKRLSSLFDGQELERQRLSRELHDSLGQQILAIKMKLEKAVLNEEDQHKILDEAIELSTLTAKEIRIISNDLSPAVLSEFGLATALNNLKREFQSVSQTEIELLTELPEGLNAKQETYIFRICQEALNNITKHSHSTNVKIILSYKSKYMYLEISDNGIGFENTGDFLIKGNGLSNMKERVHLLGGRFEIISKPNHGTTIKIKLPVQYKTEGYD